MRIRPLQSFVLSVFFFPLFFSCAAVYDVSVGKDGSAALSFSATVGPRAATLVSNLAGVPASSSAPLVDAAAAERSLRGASGVRQVSLKNADSRSLSGTLSVSRLDRFLSPRFARVVHLESGGGRVSLSMDRASAPEILASLPPELSDYLSALMAPIATGEELSGPDYLDLVSSVYGEGIAREIRDAKIRVALSLPGPAASAAGGSIGSGKAEFVFSLLEILTLERPLTIEAAWR